MGTALPPALRAAIATLAAEHAGRDLKARAARQSARYRSRGDSSALVAEQDAAAYAAVRLPATYAAVASALDELAIIAPDLVPQSLLDAGCGPGSAAFAALERFPGIETVHLVDRNTALLDAADRLGALSGLAQGRRVHRQVAALETAALPPADLVSLSYALVELAEREVAALALRLFEAARRALILVEPGSTTGLHRIRLAREALIAAGAQVIAPCTHASACPLPPPDWCHFSVRLARSRDHLRAKSASVPFEDEPFSYLIAVRHVVAPSLSERILAPPKVTKAGVELRCCGIKGIVDRQIPARNPHFSVARKRRWGDIIDPPESPAAV